MLLSGSTFTRAEGIGSLRATRDRALYFRVCFAAAQTPRRVSPLERIECLNTI